MSPNYELLLMFRVFHRTVGLKSIAKFVHILITYNNVKKKAEYFFVTFLTKKKKNIRLYNGKTDSVLILTAKFWLLISVNLKTNCAHKFINRKCAKNT